MCPVLHVRVETVCVVAKVWNLTQYGSVLYNLPDLEEVVVFSLSRKKDRQSRYVFHVIL